MPIRELLPARITVNREVLARLPDRELMQVAIQLYRESSHVIQACAQNHAPATLTDRSRAICCGLLVRLGKYMLAVDTLVTHQESSADVLMAINRCMLESAVNVTYLLAVDTPEVYDEFVKKGLGPEREYHDLVQANIAGRGGIATPMEDRILQSIRRVIQQSGVRIDEIPVRHQLRSVPYGARGLDRPAPPPGARKYVMASRLTVAFTWNASVHPRRSRGVMIRSREGRSRRARRGAARHPPRDHRDEPLRALVATGASGRTRRAGGTERTASEPRLTLTR